MSGTPRALLPGRGQIFMTAAANPLNHPQLNPIVQEQRLLEMIYNVFLSNNESLLLKSGIKLLPGGRNRFSSYGVWRWEKKAIMKVCMGYVTRYFLKGIQGHWGSSPAFPLRAVGLKLSSLDALINKNPSLRRCELKVDGSLSSTVLITYLWPYTVVPHSAKQKAYGSLDPQTSESIQWIPLLPNYPCPWLNYIDMYCTFPEVSSGRNNLFLIIVLF